MRMIFILQSRKRTKKYNIISSTRSLTAVQQEQFTLNDPWRTYDINIQWKFLGEFVTKTACIFLLFAFSYATELSCILH